MQFPTVLPLISTFPTVQEEEPLQESIKDLKKRVEEIGRLGFKADIPVKYFDRKELRKYIGKLYDSEYPRKLAEKEALFIKLMGYGAGAKIDLKEERRKIVVANAGGLYNEKTGELFALEEYRDKNYLHSMILAHELRHGIQDQHFDLSELLGDCVSSDFDDRRLALLAALEGDAGLIMMHYSDFDPDTMATDFNTDALLSFFPKASSARLSNVPEIVKHQLVMPYIEGLKFVNSILERKNWKGVNKILKSPPVSSEQILHPEKYLKKELPLSVEIGFKPDGYALYHSGVIGEYYLNILLQTRNMYKDYAAGWGGDRFEIYQKAAPSSCFFIWESLWDDERSCGNFYRIFKSFIEKKFNVNFSEGKTKTTIFIAGRSAAEKETAYFFIHKGKNRIFYVRTNDRNQINTFIEGGHYD